MFLWKSKIVDLSGLLSNTNLLDLNFNQICSLLFFEVLKYNNRNMLNLVLKVISLFKIKLKSSGKKLKNPETEGILDNIL